MLGDIRHCSCKVAVEAQSPLVAIIGCGHGCKEVLALGKPRNCPSWCELSWKVLPCVQGTLEELDHYQAEIWELWQQPVHARECVWVVPRLAIEDSCLVRRIGSKMTIGVINEALDVLLYAGVKWSKG